MSLYGDSNGPNGICDRCKCCFSLDELMSDPNFPGLRVCRFDLDDYDPYLLPPRETEDITLRFPRPDQVLTIITIAPGDPGWPIDTNSP